MSKQQFDSTTFQLDRFDAIAKATLAGVTGSVEFDKTNQNTKMDTVHYMETKPDMSWTSLKWN